MTATTSDTDQQDEMVSLSPGQKLRDARLAAGLELRDVAAKTRQSQETLKALEAMETTHIADTILRMQARTYADCLGLDGEVIAAEYAAVRGATNAQAMPAEVADEKTSQRKLMIVAGAGLGIVLLVGGLLVFAGSERAEQTGELAVSARVAGASKSLQTSRTEMPDAEDEFAIQALRSAWIEIRGSDGTVFRSRTMAAGETYFPRKDAGWTVTVRDAGAFRWRLGKSVSLPFGEDEQTLYSLSVDRAWTDSVLAQSSALADAGEIPSDRR